MKPILRNTIIKIAHQETVKPEQLERCAHKCLSNRLKKKTAAKLKSLIERILKKDKVKPDTPAILKFKPKHQKAILKILRAAKKAMAMEGGEPVAAERKTESKETPKTKEEKKDDTRKKETATDPADEPTIPAVDVDSADATTVPAPEDVSAIREDVDQERRSDVSEEIDPQDAPLSEERPAEEDTEEVIEDDAILSPASLVIELVEDREPIAEEPKTTEDREPQPVVIDMGTLAPDAEESSSKQEKLTAQGTISALKDTAKKATGKAVSFAQNLIKKNKDQPDQDDRFQEPADLV